MSKFRTVTQTKSVNFDHVAKIELEKSLIKLFFIGQTYPDVEEYIDENAAKTVYEIMLNEVRN